MHFDIHFRSDVVAKIKDVVQDIRTWNINDSTSKEELAELVDKAVCFEHCASPDRPFLIGGADGSGDFPCVGYGDSVVYLVTAIARLYEAQSRQLAEIDVSNANLVDFLWLPEDKAQGRTQFLSMFSQLMGEEIEYVCSKSDYYDLTIRHGGSAASPEDLIETLILPGAHDADNIGIQLLSTAEAGTLVRLMRFLSTNGLVDKPVYLLEDTTMALPMVTSPSTLFFEIAKRYACRAAEDAGIAYMTLSKSHNMPHMDLIEDLILKKNPTGEHWFIRIPFDNEWKGKKDILQSRKIPPVGAVSYLFKLHKTTQPMRLDMDLTYWKKNIFSEDKAEQLQREIQVFRDLDFASHDQRCYGYPYPIKACHDMASLTNDERVAMRKQIIDEAVKAGLKRKNFVDASILTGHK